MKKIIFSIFVLILPVILKAQQRDLNFYLEKAKENSPLINKSKNENKIVDLDLKQIKSVLSKPEINIESSVLLAPIISHDKNSSGFKLASADAVSYTGYDLAVTDGGQYQALVTMKQPLLNGSKYRTYAEKADVSHQINENNIALTEHELNQLVSYQYILCVKANLQSQNVLDLINELKSELQIMQKLVESAIYKQTDLMLLKIEYQNYESELETFKSEYRNNLYDLNLVCGINDTGLVQLQTVDFELKPDLNTESQFLTSYKLDSLSIKAEQSVYELKYKPQLDLFANAGLNAVYQPSFDRFGLSAGVTLSWNIFDGNQKKMQREKTGIYLQNIDFEKRNFITKNEINKQTIISQIHSYNQRIAISEDQLNQYNTLLNAYSKELSQGEVSVMEYKNLLKDIAAKKQENLLLKMEKQALINSYNYWSF